MKRVLFFLFFIGIITINVSFASAEPAAPGKSVKVTIMGDGAAAPYISASGTSPKWYLVPGVRVVYQPKFFGAGGEVMSFYGTQQNDFYLFVVGLVKLGWFHLGLGTSMMVRLPQVPLDQSILWTSMLGRPLPAVSLGINAPIWKIGPGRLGLNASLDTFLSASPIPASFVSANANDKDSGLGLVLIGGILFPYIFIKLTGGISYVIAF